MRDFSKEIEHANNQIQIDKQNKIDKANDALAQFNKVMNVVKPMQNQARAYEVQQQQNLAQQMGNMAVAPKTTPLTQQNPIVLGVNKDMNNFTVQQMPSVQGMQSLDRNLAKAQALNQYQDNNHVFSTRTIPVGTMKDLIKDVPKYFGANALAGTADTINAGYTNVNQYLGNDATTINAQALYNYGTNQKEGIGSKIGKKASGVLANTMTLGNVMLQPAISTLTETDNEAFKHLENFYKKHPDNERLKNLYESIKNQTYTGTAQDISNELDAIQKQIYQGFKNKYTQDEADRIARLKAEYEEKYGSGANVVLDAFGTVGRMTPSILMANATGGIAGLAGATPEAIAAAGQVGSMATLGLGAAGGAQDEALAEGAKYRQALNYGRLAGAVEVGTELIGGEKVNKFLFGGKSQVTPFTKLVRSLTGNADNIFANIATDVAGEMTEEALSAAINPFIKWSAYGYESGKGPLASSGMSVGDYIKGIFTDAVAAIPSTLLLMGGSVAQYGRNSYEVKQVEKRIDDTYNAIEKSIMESTELDETTKKEWIKEAKEAKEEAKSNLTMKVQEKQQTEQNTEQTTDKNALKNDFQEQGNINTLPQNEQLSKNVDALNLKQNDNRLSVAQSTIRQDIERLHQKGIALNIKEKEIKTLEAVEQVTGKKIILNEELMGTTINGLNDKKNGVYQINPGSKKAIEFIVAHEALHDKSNTDAYNELAQFAIDYAKKKNNYEGARETLRQAYENNNQTLTDAELDEEVTNDIVAEALGTQEFLNELAINKPTILSRIRDFILKIKAKLGNEDAKFLLGLEQRVNNAMKAQQNEGSVKNQLSVDSSGNVEYNNTRFSKNITRFERGQVNSEVKTWRANQEDGLGFISLSKEGYKSYIYNKIGDSVETLYRVEGNDDFINFVRKEIENGTFTSTEGFNKIASILKSRYRSNSANNSIVSNGRGNNRNNKLLDRYGRRKQEANNANVITKGDGNSRLENSNKSSFNLSKNIEEGTEKYNEIMKSYMDELTKFDPIYATKKQTQEHQQQLKERDKKLEDVIKDTFDVRTKKDIEKYEKIVSRVSKGMPVEASIDISNWKIQNKSPYSESYYNADGITWDGKPEGSLRIANHWNFMTNDAKTHTTLKGLENYPYTIHRWLLAKYNNGKYEILKDYGPISDFDTKISEREKGYGTNIEKLIEELKKEQQDTNDKLSVDTSEKDSQGRTLSVGQQEYFKDSKVRDENGNLLEVYHGTNADFNTFDSTKFGKHTGTLKGIWLTDKIINANAYGNNIIQCYVNITNPGSATEVTMSKEQYSKLLKNVEVKDTNIDSSWEYFKDRDDFDILAHIQRLYKNKGKTLQSFYDDVIDITGIDGIYDGKYLVDGSPIWIAFNSNQVKKVSNTNPTKNDDIRYSQDGNWNEFLEKNIPKKKGKRTIIKNNAPPLVQANEALKKQNEATTEKASNELNMKPKETKEKVRRWTNTAKQNEMINEAIGESIQDMPYEPLSNQATLNKANATIENVGGYENFITTDKDGKRKLSSNVFDGKMNSGHTFTVEDIALGERLIQEAIKNGDYDVATELVYDVAIAGTELGQAVQAMSMIKRMTPEGQLMYMKRVADRINKKNNLKGNNNNKIEISQETAKEILQAKNEQELETAIEKAKQELADQMPVTLAEKIAEWRYLAMLGNPKTHIRNVLANVAMRGTYEVKNGIQRMAEQIANDKLEERTRTFKKPSDEVKAFAEESLSGNKELLSGGGKYNVESDIKSRRKIFNNNVLANVAMRGTYEVKNGIQRMAEQIAKVLEGFRKGNSAALDIEDSVFAENAYKENLAEYLTANGIKTQEDIQNNPDIVAKAEKFAVEEAQKVTFHQFSKVASLINQAENINGLSKLFVGGVIPFKKTPINIAKTGASYSPLGLAETLTYEASQLKKGNITANQFIDRISQGLTGTALMSVGMLLAKLGLVKASTDDDEEYAEDIGQTKAYTIKLGDKSYDLSWLSPSAMPLLMGAELYNAFDGKEGVNWDAISESFARTLNPLTEMSLIQGVTSALSSFKQNPTDMIGDIGKSIAESYAGQFIPTLGSQINKTIDKTVRSTKADKTSAIPEFNKFMRQQLNKIPGGSFLLEPATDVWGNEVKRSDNVAFRMFDAFLNPAQITQDKTTDVDKEILKIYNINKNKDVTPDIPKNTFKQNNYSYDMSAKEYTQFKKDYGQTAYNKLEALFKTDEYKNMTESEKEKAISSVYDEAKDTARENYGITFENLSKQYGADEALSRLFQSQAYEKYKSSGVDAETYYKAYMNLKGKTKKNDKIKAINQATTDRATRQKLYKTFGIN